MRPSTTRGLILAAGRAMRLRPLTAEIPKCLLQVGSRTILERALDNFEAAGLDDIWVATGYAAERIREYWPQTVHNPFYQSDNILGTFSESIHLWRTGAVCSYSDIVVSPGMVEALRASEHELSIVVDAAWRKRYQGRTQHPVDEAELVHADPDGRLAKVGKGLDPDGAVGEFVGLWRVDGSLAERAARELEALLEADGASWRGRYVAHFLTHLAETGAPVGLVYSSDSWFEIDTAQDLAIARDGLRPAAS